MQRALIQITHQTVHQLVQSSANPVVSNVKSENTISVAPPYPDFGSLLSTEAADEVTRLAILTEEWVNAHAFSFPQRYQKIYQL